MPEYLMDVNATIDGLRAASTFLSNLFQRQPYQCMDNIMVSDGIQLSIKRYLNCTICFDEHGVGIKVRDGTTLLHGNNFVGEN